VPLVHMSIRWWRTQHPQPVLMGGPGTGLAPEMKRVLLISFIALVSLMFFLVRERYELEALRAQVDVLRREGEAA